jgi:hypothetical protein
MAMDGKRGWLAAVAVLLAVLMVAGSIGLEAGVCLAAAAGAGVLGYRFLRARGPARGPVVYCLRCGETLPSTARQCRSCGSASWGCATQK